VSECVVGNACGEKIANRANDNEIYVEKEKR
jgi:hypothetical protein